MKPHLQLKREPCELGDDITSASLPNHLEPVPCAKCEGYQQRIAELEAELKLAELILANLIIDTEPKSGD